MQNFTSTAMPMLQNLGLGVDASVGFCAPLRLRVDEAHIGPAPRRGRIADGDVRSVTPPPAEEGTGEYGRKASDDFYTLNGAGDRSPRGIRSDGTTMWVADAADDEICSYRFEAER